MPGEQKKCPVSVQKLQLYFDGELSVEEAREVKDHARSCFECSAELESLAFVQNVVRKEFTMPAPAGFASSVMREINRKAQKAPSLWGRLVLFPAWPRAMAYAAAAAVFFFTLFSVWQPDQKAVAEVVQVSSLHSIAVFSTSQGEPVVWIVEEGAK
jgi:anti-sigma factor RsiW